jgi:hypothetical protein
MRNAVLSQVPLHGVYLGSSAYIYPNTRLPQAQKEKKEKKNNKNGQNHVFNILINQVIVFDVSAQLNEAASDES